MYTQFGIEDTKEAKSHALINVYGQICQEIYCMPDETNMQVMWTLPPAELYNALRDCRYPVFTEFFAKMPQHKACNMLAELVSHILAM